MRNTGFNIISVIAILATIGWYIYLYYSTGDLAGACVCPEITSATYAGYDWPGLLPEFGCGDCGIPRTFKEFFKELLLILAPGLIIYTLYLFPKYLAKNTRKI